MMAAAESTAAGTGVLLDSLFAVSWALTLACAPNTASSNDDSRGAEEVEMSQINTHVWIDTDPAIGLPGGEVDDGLMLIQAFHSPELEIHGVSTVFGNTSHENAYPIAKDVVARFGPPGLTVLPGAASADELGASNPAVEGMAVALGVRCLTILAVGPVTNVGTLLQLHPDLAAQIDSIIVVAARRVGQRFVSGSAETPFRDFNFELDPTAMQVLLDSSVPLVFAPWEVSSHVWIRQADLDALAESGGTGAWIAAACASWIARWKANFGVDGFNPFDTLAVAWLTHPDWIESMEVGVWIEEGDDDVRAGEIKPFLHVDPGRADVRRAIYTYRPDRRFQAALIERLAGPVSR